MELNHKYPQGVHLINTNVASSLIERISHPDINQPFFTHLVKKAFQYLFDYIVGQQLPLVDVDTQSRMALVQAEGNYSTKVIDPTLKAVCVDLARAGMVPSQLFYEELHYYLKPQNIRQDHVYAARRSNEKGEVTGVDISGSKIGGDIDNAFVFIPDPMGATGSTIAEILNIYKTQVKGTARKLITAHLIITPEFIKKIKTAHPEVEIYALRLDRGLSEKSILQTIPGTHWDQEKGLNDHDYIVPGAGGVGELLNNSFV